MTTTLDLDALTPTLTAYCRSRVRTWHTTPDDVLQETLTAVWSSWPTYTPTHPPHHWALGVARHKVGDAHRARPPIPGDVPDHATPAPTPLDHAIQAEDARQVHRLLRLLTIRRRQVLLLRVMGGLTVRDTAHILGMTDTAVRVEQHRALNALRAVLGLPTCDHAGCEPARRAAEQAAADR